MADLMLLNPSMKLSELSEELGKSPNWISLIRNSDAFKAYFEYRRKEFNQEQAARITGSLNEVAAKALEIVVSRLDKGNGAAVPLELAADIGMKALDRLGYGSKGSGAAVNVNINQNNGQNGVVALDAAELRAARDRIRAQENRALTGAEGPGPTLSLPQVEEEETNLSFSDGRGAVETALAVSEVVEEAIVVEER